MTEQVLSGTGVSQETPAVAQETVVSTPSVAEVSAPINTEKLIPQSEVGKIAGASRKEGHDKGYERGYQEALSKFQQQQVPSNSSVQPKSQDELERLVAHAVAESFKRQNEENVRLAEEKRVNDYYSQVANQIRPKIEDARAKHEDFDTKVNDLQLDKVPHIIELVNSVSNAGEVLYDLANNPHKLGILNALHSPALALREVQRLSQSLQNNQAAQDKTSAKNPLSTIEPSTVGKQSGELSGQQITDAARAKYRF